jgi:hypothetical protein
MANHIIGIFALMILLLAGPVLELFTERFIPRGKK